MFSRRKRKKEEERSVKRNLVIYGLNRSGEINSEIFDGAASRILVAPKKRAALAVNRTSLTVGLIADPPHANGVNWRIRVWTGCLRADDENSMKSNNR